ncbi:MAG: molybdopterin-dependent oxidoreductase [Acidobacteria bacterium]|nr:molybdopterin-dependent oxidoreductase [Acidobacteriota bacterium]
MTPSNRREFFARSAAAAGSLLGGAALLLPDSFRKGPAGPDEAVPAPGRPRTTVPSACWQCVTRCPILGTVEGERLVKIDGNPASQATRGRICAKGQAGINQVEDPDRVLHPLLRTGARGEGRWKRITWDEALDLLVEGGEVAGRKVRGLRSLRDSGVPEKFLFHYGRCVGSDWTILMDHFLPAYGTGSVGDHDAICMAAGSVAGALTGGGSPFMDLSKAAMVLNFGSSPLEATTDHIPTAQRFVEALARGVRVVSFDPRLSNTAAKSTEWVPLKPATDLAVLLAMSHAILEAGLEDGAFISGHTNATVPELRAHLAPFTPAWAENLSGVPEGRIRSLALDYARSKPGVCLSARGAFMHHNGVQTQRAIHLLQALTGNVDPAGRPARRPAWRFPFPTPAPATRKLPVFEGEPGAYSHPFSGVSHQILRRIAKGPDRPEIYMLYCHNPVYSNGDCDANARVLADPGLVPFLVSVDVGLGESTLLADLVLPDATYLERWTCDGKVTPEGLAEYQLRQPIVAPRGQARHFPDVACEVARRLGVDLGFSSAEAFIRAACEATPEVRAAGGFEAMKALGVWVDPRPPEPGNPRGPMQLRSEALEKAGFSALPAWMPVPEHGAMTEEDLVLVTFKVPVQTQSRSQNCKWLTELYHENRAWIHPEAAARRGLRDGEEVLVRSAIGQIRIPLKVTEGIHPRALAISHHCGHWSRSDYAAGQPAPHGRPEADSPLRWWRGHGAHVNRIIPTLGDPIAGAMRWNDTVVQVRKLPDGVRGESDLPKIGSSR